MRQEHGVAAAALLHVHAALARQLAAVAAVVGGVVERRVARLLDLRLESCVLPGKVVEYGSLQGLGFWIQGGHSGSTRESY